MPRIGDKILVTGGPYKGKVGMVVEIHANDWDDEPHYSVILETPVSISLNLNDDSSIDFADHRAFLAAASNVKLLTEMGEAIYGSDEEGDQKTL